MNAWYQVNINNNYIKKPTCGYQNCNITQILLIGGYVKVTKSLYTRAIIWVDTTLNHIDTKAILPRYVGSCTVLKSKILSNTHTLVASKNVESYHNGFKNITPDQHW